MELIKHSKFHRPLRFRLLIKSFDTPLQLKQYRFWRNKKQKLVGFCSYAFVSDDVLAKLLDGATMQKDYWQSGKNLWLAEFVAPYGHVSFIVRDTVRYFKEEFDGIRVGYWYRPTKQKKGLIGPDKLLA